MGGKTSLNKIADTSLCPFSFYIIGLYKARQKDGPQVLGILFLLLLTTALRHRRADSMRNLTMEVV